MNKIICVDFDGTIVDHAYPEIGKPVPGAIETLKIWSDAGVKIILWTMRSEITLIEAAHYVQDNGVELWGVNRNPEQDTWTESPKAYGQVYIDDAAAMMPLIHYAGFKRPCVNWKLIQSDVEKRLGL
jgi:hypothetical protein